MSEFLSASSSSHILLNPFGLSPLYERPNVRPEIGLRRNISNKPIILPKLSKIDNHQSKKPKTISPTLEKLKLSMVLIGHKVIASTKLAIVRNPSLYARPKAAMSMNDLPHDTILENNKPNEDNGNMISNSEKDFKIGYLNTTIQSIGMEETKLLLASDEFHNIKPSKVILSSVSSLNDINTSIFISHKPSLSVGHSTMIPILPTTITTTSGELPNIRESRNLDSPLKYVKKQKFIEEPSKGQDISAEKSKKKLRPKVTAKSWSITNGDNSELLHGKREKRHREIASLTKIMSCFVVLKWVRRLKLDLNMTYFKVSALAASMIGTTANLKDGDELSIWDLLHGMMLPSGNDAAYCLAENFGYHIFYASKEYKDKLEKNPDIIIRPFNPVKYFVREMNRICRELGMFDTHYANPHGLMHKYNFSTAADIGKLCCKAMKDDLFKRIVSNTIHFSNIKVPHSDNSTHRQLIWRNTNKLLYDGFEGIKTGITTTAGPCLAASLRKDNKHLIVVILNSKSSEHRWNEVKKLMNWAFEAL